MLAIRLKRTGRKGHAQYRVVVQDSHRHPSSGKVAAWLGSYDPHAKTAQLDTEKVAFYLKNGAQPSNRVAVLLKSEGVKLPKWVKIDDTQKGSLKNRDKLRKNQPKEEAKSEESSSDVTEASDPKTTEAKETEASKAETTDVPTEEKDPETTKAATKDDKTKDKTKE